jgi:phage regulator Rha-like protein
MRVAELVLLKPVEPRIVILRGVRAILDSELAELYGVRVKRLNEQVKRNAQRFPRDFMFQLSPNEQENLRSHFATSSSGHGGRRHLPYAFTEHGAIMVATVLSTKRAIEMSVFVVRAFVRLRDMLATNARVAGKLTELESRLKGHDASIHAIIEAIRELMAPHPRKRRRIGFRVPARALKAR